MTNTRPKTYTTQEKQEAIRTGAGTYHTLAGPVMTRIEAELAALGCEPGRKGSWTVFGTDSERAFVQAIVDAAKPVAVATAAKVVTAPVAASMARRTLRYCGYPGCDGGILCDNCSE